MTSKQPVLPVEGKRNVLITSSLPYVNNVPHLGNIIGSVLSADVYARFCRNRGYNTVYICGTDEYGTATETKALSEGCTAKEICDRYYPLHAEIYKWFDISFDIFGRTSTQQQTEIAQDIFNKLYKNKLTYEEVVEQLHCAKCDKFLADRFVEGTCPHCAYNDARGDQCDKCGKLLNPIELKQPRCKVCNSSPAVRSTTHVFLDLPQLQDKIVKWSEESIKRGKWSDNSIQITNSWLNGAEGLRGRCITRDLKWGTPVPLEKFKDKVFYVWFDAPIGYLSITANYTPEWQKWWKNPNVELYQFMGKDNVPFHTVIFPGSLIGTGDPYTLLHHVSTTEYLTYEGDKFSKSRSYGVFGDNAKNSGIPSEVWRYYLLSNRPESSDSNFSWMDFANKNNGELLDNLGNFINRMLKFIGSSFEGKVPEQGPLNDQDKAFIEAVNKELTVFISLLEKVQIRDGLKSLLAISSLGNKYVQENKPWQLLKEDLPRCGTVVFVTSNLIDLLTSLLEPYMPALARKVLQQLDKELSPIRDTFEFTLKSGHKIGEPVPLVAKIEPAKVEELKKMYGGATQATEFPADLRVASIMDVEDHPQATHLYVLKLDLGTGEAGHRTVVSGLKEAYPDRAVLKGKKVVVLCNLKPSKFKGVNSQGMVLAAETEPKAEGDKKTIQVLTVDAAPAGAQVLPDGSKLQSKTKYSKEDFATLDLRVVDGVATLAGVPLSVASSRVVPDNSVCAAIQAGKIK